MGNGSRVLAGPSPDVVIGACTAIIQSGQESTEDLARAFSNRGDAYNNKREYDRAIQEIDQAISLDPNLAPAFNHRGLAYAAKREYDRAIQDFD
jgi:tetratricopeptide (TPR) repeat protein